MDLKAISAQIQKLALEPDIRTNKVKIGKLSQLTLPYIKKVFSLYLTDRDILDDAKEDLMQDAMEILLRCIQKYNLSKSAFLTYYINALKYELPLKLKEYNSKGMASGWIMINRSLELRFDDIDNVEDEYICEDVSDIKLTKEGTDQLLSIFSGNILDMAIHSAIEEFNLTENEVAEMFCVPFTFIKSSKRRVRKFIAKSSK